ncbi:APC family permease [Croceicoccus sp. Ery15]|uniref:APC family permease n=1 Tax=Croceicoccus sp. Ery15 TaxID=1703338 RepID=UPI001E415A24|nr:amino acid permease [Croceicoccus sp. Ery15]
MRTGNKGNADGMANRETALKPALSRGMLAVYGIGTILGAGIYVVVGKVAGEAGALAPLAFLAAAVAAGFTGLSYAELSARIPESGGSAAYIARGFNRRWLTGITGWALILTGLVSAATITTGFAGYLSVFVALPDALLVPLVAGVLTAVAAMGVKQAAWFMALTTALEIGGLLLVIGFLGGELAHFPAAFGAALDAGPVLPLAGSVMAGAVLSFYAFIGFEDLATLAEEARDPKRAIPFAIVVSLAGALVLYLLVSAIAVSAVPPETLRDSGAPLSDILAAHNGPADLLALIGLVTILNGALAQIVMASRVIYDLGVRRGAAPSWLARIHPRTATPVLATILSGAVVALLALAFPTEQLAAGTSLLMLLIFTAACAALLAIKARGEPAPQGVRCFPAIVPAMGIVTSLALIATRVFA